MAKKKKLLNKKTEKKLIQLALTILIALVVFLYQKSPWASSNQEVKENQSVVSEKIRCVDGDTFWYKDEKIRLLGIDAPESTTRVDFLGPESSSFACDLLMKAKEIRLEQDKGNETDKYKRALYWVFLDDQLLQVSLLKEGYAKIKYIDKKTVNQQYYLQLKEAEILAKQKKKGLWAMP